MEFRILGSVEAESGGLAVDLGGLRERTLLARLLLAAGQVVSADRLADDLWAGEPPPHCMATLRVYISRLRRALGPAAAGLLTQPPGYRLRLEAGQLDAARFEQLVSDARRELDDGHAEAAAAGLRAALALWRGPALSDVADFAFAQADVARLEEARLAAIEDRVEADLACGRHASLTSELDGLAAAHPLRERLCGQLMLACYRCGRQADALRAYRDLRTRLADELGIDPNPRLHRLHEAILRQLPDLDWEPSIARPAGASAARGESGGRSGGQPRAAPAASLGQAAGPASAHTPATAHARAAPAAAPDPELASVPSPGLASAARLAMAPELAPPPGEALAPGLPAETTSFVGREAELATIKDLLELSRLLTLTGPGGSGKTRLALRAGAQALSQHPGGVWLVELAQVTRPDLIAVAVATVLSIREEPGRALPDSIITGLAGRDLLLIIDNCEHVLDAVAELVSALLRGCPELRILATSQSRLGLAGEATWPVPPLVLPPPAAADPRVVGAAESVRLFCDRAALARPGFGLTAGNVAAVSEICRRLDGIPLAIELAAARVNALTAGQLAARLDDRFRLLAGASRGGLPRHRTLRAAIEWSHELLSEAEQILLPSAGRFRRRLHPGGRRDGLPGRRADPGRGVRDRRLAGRPVPADRGRAARQHALRDAGIHSRLRAAEAGGGGGERRAEPVPPALAARLRRRSRPRGRGSGGLAGPAGIRAGQYPGRPGMEHVGRRAAAAVARPAVARSAVSRPAVARPAVARSAVRRPAVARPAVGRAAADLPLAEPALRLAGDLAPFWIIRGHIGPGRSWLDAALAAAGPGADRRLRAIALDGAGQLAAVHADYPAQRGYQEESLAIWRALGDDQKIVSCLGDLGAVAHIRGEYPAARAMYAEALELATRTGQPQQMAGSLSGLGRLALHEGKLDQATEYYLASLARFRETGDLRKATLILGNLGVVALDQGDYPLAEARFTEHLGNVRRLGDRKLTGGALTNLGMVAHNAGDFGRAAALHAEALGLAEQLGDRRLAAVALTNLGMAALARKDFGAARAFHRRSLDLSSAVGERRSIAESLAELAEVDAAEGFAARAVVLASASAAIRSAIGAPVPAPDSGPVHRVRGGRRARARHRAVQRRPGQGREDGR